MLRLIRQLGLYEWCDANYVILAFAFAYTLDLIIYLKVIEIVLLDDFQFQICFVSVSKK